MKMLVMLLESWRDFWKGRGKDALLAFGKTLKRLTMLCKIKSQRINRSI